MEYKRLIMVMIRAIKEDDVIFLQYIYTIIKKHVEAAGIVINWEKPGE